MSDDLLGAGQNRAYIASRDGRSLLMEVPSTSVRWGRALNAVSVTEVTVKPAQCTPALENAEPWAHNLVVFRDEERVWEGPLRNRLDTAGGLLFKATDPIGWTERRAVATQRNVVGGLVRDQMAWSVAQAFAADDPNVLAHLQLIGSATVTTDLAVQVAEKYHSDVLSDMGGNGGRFTALGRSIILWDEATSIGQLRDLSPENHLLDDVDLFKDGDLLGTQVWARNDTGVVRTGIHSGGSPVDPRYGQVDLIVASSATTPAGVGRTAQSAANKSYPVPLTIQVPGTAALQCSAPFPIRDLVPGVLVPVQTTTATSAVVWGMFMLTEVNVTQESGQDEVVTITLAPPSEAVA